MSESLSDMIMDPVEKIFDSVGLMQGNAAPMKRAAVGAVLGYGIAYGIKPGFAWDGDEAKQWKFTAPKDTPEDKMTYVPAWLIVVIPAVIFSTLI